MGRMDESRQGFRGRDEERGRFEGRDRSRGFEDREEYRAGSRSDQSRWPARSEQGRNDEPRSFQERNRDSEQEPYGREAWRPGEGLSQSGNYGNQTGQVGQYGQYGQSGPYGQYGQSGPYGYGNNDHGQRGQYGGGQYGRSQYGGGGQYGGGRGNYGGQPGAEAESYERYSPYNRGQPGPSQYGQPSEYERYQASQYNHYPEPHSSSRSEPDNWSRRAGQTGGDTPWDGRQRGMGEQIGEFGGAMAGRVRRMFRAPKGYTRSDERIREDVCDQLAHSQQVDPSDIEVSVKEGEVTLSGQVPERAMKWSVEQIVDAVSGVKDIHNQLRVRRDDNISTTSSTTQATASTPSTTRTTARS